VRSRRRRSAAVTNRTTGGNESDMDQARLVPTGGSIGDTGLQSRPVRLERLNLCVLLCLRDLIQDVAGREYPA